MSSTRDGARFTSGASIGSSKGKTVVSQHSADQLASRVADTRLDSQQDGVWESGRKNRNRYEGRGGSQNFNAKGWGNFGNKVKGPAHAFAAPTGDTRMNVGRLDDRNQFSYRGWEDNYGRTTVNPQRSYRSVAAKEDNVSAPRPVDAVSVKEEDRDDEKDSEEYDDDDDDDIYESDEYDTYEIQESHETGKMNGLLKDFFENLDKMKLEEIKELHCPACNNGPGAIAWYKGLQPLVNHAQNIRKGKVKVHRELAERLEEQLRIRGTSVIPVGVAFGRWRGLKQNVARDKDIVWPPMVVIRNTFLEQDDNEKWLGMGSSELLEYFNASGAVSSKHSYGPQGHRGMSLLIFEASAIGFIEAEQLSNHFEDEGIGKEAWARNAHCHNSFIPGGQRQLYGYMAEKGDLDSFNQHAHDKPLQKFDMRFYQEVVIRQLKQMREDNHLLIWYKNRVEKVTKELEVLKGSFNAVGEKMRKVSEENRIVRQRTKLHHKEIKEEMDEQEEFHRNTFKLVDDVRKEMEEELKRIQQEREEKNQYMETPSAEYRQSRLETGTTSILSQQKDTDISAEEKSKLLKHQEQRMAELKMRQYEEKVKLEEEFSAEFVRLMEKRNPH